ncbi:MAG: RIP metalloprotease RseP [Candidatus Komeilibacteria bacterium]
MLVAVITFIIVLGLLVFVHELGHFMAARRFGIKVEEFGFGFPPRLWGYRRGETIYSLNWIPLGGFVKIHGEQGEDKTASDSFSSKVAWKRIVVLSAGVLMNFIFAWALYAVGFTVGLPQTLSDEDAQQLKLSQTPVIISQIMEPSPAATAGLKIGDQISAVETVTINSIAEAQEALGLRQDRPTILHIKRGTTTLDITVRPEILATSDHPIIGVGLSRIGFVHYNVLEALWRGLQATVSMIIAIVVALAWLLKNLFTTGSVGADVAGPIGVAVMTNQVVNLGWAYVVTFAAALSINLGIINILPLPALDGGRIIFVLLEKIKGNPVSEKVEGLIHNVGFGLLLLLMVVVTYHDIVRYGGQIMHRLTTIFS